MWQELIEDSFKKAEQLPGNLNKNGRAEYLKKKLHEEHQLSISANTLLRYYKGVSIPNEAVLNALAMFLGYKDYENYIVRRTKKFRPPKTRKRNLQAQRYLLYVLLVLIGSGLIYNFFESKRKACMRWEGKKYIEMACTGNTLEKPLHLETLEKLRKIIPCDTVAFERKGNTMLWYYKSEEGIEFYSYYGLHPKNGKPLKPVTADVYEKYVKPCN